MNFYESVTKSLMSGVRTVAKACLLVITWKWFIVATFGVPELPIVVAVVTLLLFDVLNITVDSTFINEQGELMPIDTTNDIANTILFCALIIGVVIIFYGLSLL